MIPPILAASAASAALGVVSSVADAVTTKKNDQLDRTDFLTMLVAQLKAQDPLNPMESADFTAQLAQFSSLEQLMSINQRLENFTSGSGGAAGSDAVGFLGREVATAGGVLSVTGGDAGAVAFTLPQAGDVTLEIADSSGNPVATLELGNQEAGAHSFDPDAIAGAPELADGDYVVQVSLKTGAGQAQPIATRAFGRVTGVDLSADPPVLLIGNRRVAMTDVREVRAVGEETAAAE